MLLAQKKPGRAAEKTSARTHLSSFLPSTSSMSTLISLVYFSSSRSMIGVLKLNQHFYPWVAEPMLKRHTTPTCVSLWSQRQQPASSSFESAAYLVLEQLLARRDVEDTVAKGMAGSVHVTLSAWRGGTYVWSTYTTHARACTPMHAVQQSTEAETETRARTKSFYARSMEAAMTGARRDGPEWEA